MLNPKVVLTDELIRHIQEERMANTIGAAVLSGKIGKPDGYISALENRRVKTIASSLLIKIFQVLYDNLSEEEIIAKIESIINASSKINEGQYSKAKSNTDNDDVIVSVLKYDDENLEKLNKDYRLLIDHLVEGLNIVFDKINDKKDAVDVLKAFIRNLHSDMSFMLSIISLPFCRMEKVEPKVKKQVFEAIFNLLKENGLECSKPENNDDDD